MTRLDDLVKEEENLTEDILFYGDIWHGIYEMKSELSAELSLRRDRTDFRKLTEDETTVLIKEYLRINPAVTEVIAFKPVNQNFNTLYTYTLKGMKRSDQLYTDIEKRIGKRAIYANKGDTIKVTRHILMNDEELFLAIYKDGSIVNLCRDFKFAIHTWDSFKRPDPRRIEQLTEEVEGYEKDLTGLTEHKKELKTKRKELTSEIYYRRQIPQDFTIELGKHSLQYGTRDQFSEQIFSLWLLDKSGRNKPELVYMLDKDCKPAHIYGRRKDQGLQASTKYSNLSRGFDTAIKYHELKPGTIITRHGNVIEGEPADYAMEFFQKVQGSIPVLPCPESPTGYIIKGPKGGEDEIKRRIDPRTWGQEYIHEQNPAAIQQGSVFGTGGDYLIYNFGKLVIVEPSETNRATYIFNAERFEELRQRYRIELIMEQPEGFLDRLVHDDKQKWESDVSRILSQHA
jgi:hypothetical protein